MGIEMGVTEVKYEKKIRRKSRRIQLRLETNELINQLNFCNVGNSMTSKHSIFNNYHVILQGILDAEYKYIGINI